MAQYLEVLLLMVSCSFPPEASYLVYFMEPFVSRFEVGVFFMLQSLPTLKAFRCKWTTQKGTEILATIFT